MPDLEPITRDEKLWSGEDLEPITRREMYIKHLYDETQVIPDKPITREEMFILKAGEELHDVTIEQLTATENGTYSEQGVAYSPVIVEVPLPDNAYLLKDIANTPASIATFTDGSALPMPKLEIAVEPQQDLHGYDAPWASGAGKNKFDDSIYTTSTYSKSGHFFTNTQSDTRTFFAFILKDENDATLITSNIATTGLFISNSFTTSSTNSRLNVKHNGATKDLSVYFTESLPAGTYKFVMTVNGANPSVDGGLSFGNIMIINANESDTSYAPYSNECPINGWSAVDVNVSGVNVWDEEWEVGQLNYSTGNNISSSTDIRSKNYIPCLPNTQYYIKCPKATIICGYDKSKNYVDVVHYNDSNRTFNTLDSVYYIRFCTLQSYGTTYNNDISINYPSTDTDYHAYNGQTYTIDLDGTRYGGEVDVVNGGGTDDRANVIIDENSAISLWGTPRSPWVGFSYIPVPAMQSGRISGLENNYLKSLDGNTDNWNIYGVNGVLYIIFNENVIGGRTINDIKGFLETHPLQVIYPLATPTTFNSQPTRIKSLEGVNNIWADCGDIIDGQYFGKEV